MIFSAGSMTARASSGSRSSISSVEPLMSANSAVTVLRSPSIASDAAPSAATRTCDLSEETVVETAAFVAPIAVPHFLQNRAPGLTDDLHAGQINSSFAPHPSQNEASPGLSWWQDGQRIGSPVALLLPRADGGRRMVLGSYSITLRVGRVACDPGESPSHVNFRMPTLRAPMPRGNSGD